MRHDSKFAAAGLFLALWTCTVVFWIIVYAGSTTYQKHVRTEPTLNDWSLARILAELGEYDQKIPNCAGLVDGMTGYAYAKVSSLTGQLKGVILVCK